ncbi:MAG TPA: serine hydrolase [Pyrinomonadaceae bacterium]|jgi:beta-lactamase class A
MKKSVAALSFLLAFCLFCASSNAQKIKTRPEFRLPENYKPLALEASPAHQTLLAAAIGAAVEKLRDKNLTANDVAATLIDLRDPNDPKWASVRGEEKIYPASVVKMFYMVALERWLEDGRVKPTPEMERGLRDMIVDSSNEATQYILDVLTGVSSGAELPEKEFAEWANKRNVVNRFYARQGYRNINVNQKTFCEDAYGIEQQFRGYKGNNRNMLTTNATARLLAEIVLGKTNTPERTKAMMDLMKRDFSGASKDPDDQAHGFTGIALSNKGLKDARLWSKAGWTSKTRHDAAYIETPDGMKFVLVVFTENFANERGIIPSVAENVLENLGKIK